VCPGGGNQVLCPTGGSPAYVCTPETDTQCGGGCDDCHAMVGPRSTCVNHACTCQGLDCNMGGTVGHRCVAEGTTYTGLTTPNTSLNLQMYCGTDASNCQDCTTSTGSGSVCDGSHHCACPGAQVSCTQGGSVACSAETNSNCNISGTSCVDCTAASPAHIDRGATATCTAHACTCPANTCNNAAGCYNNDIHCGAGACSNCTTGTGSGHGGPAYCDTTAGACTCPANVCDGSGARACGNDATHCGHSCDDCHSGASTTHGPDAACAASGSCYCPATQPSGSLGVVSCTSGCRNEDNSHCGQGCADCDNGSTGRVCSGNSHSCVCPTGGNGNPQRFCGGFCSQQSATHCGCNDYNCSAAGQVCDYALGTCHY
jgi:hypothetical protein